MPAGEAAQWAADALAEAGCLASVGEAELAIRRLTAVDLEDAAAVVTAPEIAAIEEYVSRRRRGDPPAYILGGCEFMGRWIRLDETTYIPRPWTETMVRRGVAILRRAGGSPNVVDVGTGSGAIALVIAESVPACRVWAVDLDERALRWARANVASVSTKTASTVAVLNSDLLEALPQQLTGRVDLVIGSLPYVPTSELPTLPRDYREHEPGVALDGGPEGLALDLRVMREALAWLRAGGRVMLELGHRQGAPLVIEARRLGYKAARVHVDEEGDDLFLECVR